MLINRRGWSCKFVRFLGYKCSVQFFWSTWSKHSGFELCTIQLSGGVPQMSVWQVRKGGDVLYWWTVWFPPFLFVVAIATSAKKNLKVLFYAFHEWHIAPRGYLAPPSLPPKSCVHTHYRICHFSSKVEPKQSRWTLHDFSFFFEKTRISSVSESLSRIG